MTAVQIFISYARKDNRLPPNTSPRDGKGFITALKEYLEHAFDELGAPCPELWLDTRNIDPAQQFDPRLHDAIAKSSILLIVLSPNWMSSAWCQQELKIFAERWQGDKRLRERIVVACKRYVDRGKRPSFLQGQQGYDFFEFEGPSESGTQIDFYSWGRPQLATKYEDVIKQLGGYLHRRAQHVDGRAETSQPLSPPPAPEPTPRHPSRERTVFLAKPAPDMVVAYDRLVKELQGDGYTVVPDPQSKIPEDLSATSFVDRELDAAELSVHLLGARLGYAPEDAEPIARLQLQRARARVGQPVGGSDGGPGAPVFRRIIWAPKLLDFSHDPETASVPDSIQERDPFAVLAKFEPEGATLAANAGDIKAAGDKVDDSGLNKFVKFVIEHLAKADTGRGDPGKTAEGGTVYVCHAPNDEKYALEVAKALRDEKIPADIPALDGDPGDLRRFHEQMLLECDAVVLCWGAASEVWARQRARDLNWRKLGRSAQFASRGVIAGPPPGVRKSLFVKDMPPSEIDLVLDHTQPGKPLADALAPLIKIVQPAAR